jgi:hypothetical protein
VTEGHPGGRDRAATLVLRADLRIGLRNVRFVEEKEDRRVERLAAVAAGRFESAVTIAVAVVGSEDRAATSPVSAGRLDLRARTRVRISSLRFIQTTTVSMRS